MVHLELSEANDLISRLHRHHKPVQGHRFSIGAIKDGALVGAAVVGRPVARSYDPKKVIEVTRLVTDGTPNACSTLYAAAARAARELGYESIQTYILDSEPGTSLLASGWTLTNTTQGDTWTRPSRPGRRTDQPTTPKQRWVKTLAGR